MTFDMIGGRAAVTFSSEHVEILWAFPNPGFTVDVTGGGARVEFESDSHETRLDAWWQDGPQWLIREDPTGDAAGVGPDDSTSTTEGD